MTQEPGSNQVSIKYDTISTQEAQGSLNDQRIQQLLLFAARNNYNSGVRMDSVDVLTQTPNDSRVREVLMYSLQNDTNPGVRMKALDGLSGLVRQDEQVRDAVLQALVTDANSRRADAGAATGGTDESGQQGARGADPGCRRRIRTLRSARRRVPCWRRRRSWIKGTSLVVGRWSFSKSQRLVESERLTTVNDTTVDDDEVVQGEHSLKHAIKFAGVTAVVLALASLALGQEGRVYREGSNWVQEVNGDLVGRRIFA